MSLETKHIRDIIKLATDYEWNPKALLSHIKMLAEIYEDDDKAKRKLENIISKIITEK